MNAGGKFLLLILVIAYAMSPLDMMPGPIDDILVIALSMAATSKKKRLS